MPATVGVLLVSTWAKHAGDVQDDEEEHEHRCDEDPNHGHPARREPLRPRTRITRAVRVRLGHVSRSLRDNVSLSNQGVSVLDVTYTSLVPRLWNETIEAHRREVRDAILATTAALVDREGLRSVTMAQIAEETGIGRATLYKYFPSVEAILLAWHGRQITAHLEHLAAVRDQAGDPRERLEAVLEAYALISHEYHGHHNSELAAFLHQDEQVGRAGHQLHVLIRDLIKRGVESGHLRNDVAPDELASYCLHALTAARSLPSKRAIQRLVAVTLTGLHPRRLTTAGRR